MQSTEKLTGLSGDDTAPSKKQKIMKKKRILYPLIGLAIVSIIVILWIYDSIDTHGLIIALLLMLIAMFAFGAAHGQHHALGKSVSFEDFKLGSQLLICSVSPIGNFVVVKNNDGSKPFYLLEEVVICSVGDVFIVGKDSAGGKILLPIKKA